MKLLFCSGCQDVFKLIKDEKRFCRCKQSVGWYIDHINAEYFGPFCVPLGIDNPSLMNALIHREAGKATRFAAFIMPHDCATFKLMPKKELACDYEENEGEKSAV